MVVGTLSVAAYVTLFLTPWCTEFSMHTVGIELMPPVSQRRPACAAWWPCPRSVVFHACISKSGFTSLQFRQGTRLRKQNVDYVPFIVRTNSQQRVAG